MRTPFGQTRRLRLLLVTLVGVSALAAGLTAQQGARRAARQQSQEPGHEGEIVSLRPGQIPYDGRFVFARLRYTVTGWGDLDSGPYQVRGGWGDPPWSHDYPSAERNFMKLLKGITKLDPYIGKEGGAIVEIGSKELFRYPLAYMCEPGYWTQTDQEAANLRAYLKKGGFIIFDDFRGRDWDNFTTQFQRVIPNAQFVELDLNNPIFHSFFDIKTLAMHQFYDRGRPVFSGVFEDNDPKKRLLAIVNFNNDISEFWEWSDTGWEPIDFTNEAFKFGVNYIIYGMTH